MVEFNAPRGIYAPGGPYVVTSKLPERDGEFEYRIRSALEEHERLARESELMTMSESKAAPAGEGEAMTRRPTLRAEEYRALADQEAELAKAATTNEIKAQHYAMADYYTRLAEAQERLPRMKAAPAGKAKR
jgi:hypothetical protein